jgi:putative flippase GtrA
MRRNASLLARLRSRPQYERVAVVAALGAAASWLTYEIIFFLNPIEPRATSSWIIAYGVGVIRQHHLHRLISFPDPPVRYSVSLARDYASSIVILGTSAGLNWFLVSSAAVDHRLAWLLCTCVVALSGYLAMKVFVFRSLAIGRSESRESGR